MSRSMIIILIYHHKPINLIYIFSGKYQTMYNNGASFMLWSKYCDEGICRTELGWQVHEDLRTIVLASLYVETSNLEVLFEKLERTGILITFIVFSVSFLRRCKKLPFKLSVVM